MSSDGLAGLPYEELLGVAVRQDALIETLTARVAELERRLGLNSTNSSRPPSSDGPARPRTRSLREPSDRPVGKQPGAPGAALRQVDTPDETVVHRPDRCGGCGRDLAGAPVTATQVRQVVDLPPVRPRVVEHQVVTCTCACGQATTAAVGVNAPTQYGPAITALAVYLRVRQHLPVARIAQLCRDAFAITVSPGWVAGVAAPTALALTGFTDRVQTALADAPAVHLDETGIRVDGTEQWVHSASTDRVTHYHLDQKRGTAAMDRAGVLPAMSGVAVHDCWTPYFCYRTLDHAVCNVHLLRELRGWYEHDTQANAWADQAATILLDGRAAVETARHGGLEHLDPDHLTDLTTRWATMITAARAAHPRRSSRDRLAALLERLTGLTPEIWRFAHDFTVPFSNNQAERDIRMVKLQAKISGGWRTDTAARDWLTIRSYISTLIKNRLNVLDGIRDALTGNAWLPPPPTPTAPT